MQQRDQIEKILDKRQIDGVVHYFIKWKGYFNQKDYTWEAIKNLSAFELRIQQFQKENEQNENKIKERIKTDYKQRISKIQTEKRAKKNGLIKSGREGAAQPKVIQLDSSQNQQSKKSDDSNGNQKVNQISSKESYKKIKKIRKNTQKNYTNDKPKRHDKKDKSEGHDKKDKSKGHDKKDKHDTQKDRYQEKSKLNTSKNQEKAQISKTTPSQKPSLELFDSRQKFAQKNSQLDFKIAKINNFRLIENCMMYDVDINIKDHRNNDYYSFTKLMSSQQILDKQQKGNKLVNYLENFILFSLKKPPT